MPPRLNLAASFRALSIRSRPAAQWIPPRVAGVARTFADEAKPPSPPPSTNGQDATSIPSSQPGSISNEAQIHEEANFVSTSFNNAEALGQLELVANGLDPFEEDSPGHKFGLPALPVPSRMHMKHRYEPVVAQITKLLMRDGKLSKAQRDMALILNYLRTSSPPRVNPARPLVPGAPPPSHLPLNPVTYLTLAIDSVAPLIRIRNFSGLAGGGMALSVPVPLGVRQRRRMAWMWIMETVNKKPSKGSGRTMLAHRIGEELVAVIEGRSTVWDKRQQLHKLGTASRANINSRALMKKR